MNRCLFLLYRFLLIPSAVVLLPFAALFHRKLREGLRLRKIPVEPLTDATDPIWIHAASGEFEYAKAVIRELKSRAPRIPIVVTFFSPTFAKGVAGFPGVDRAVALPLDLPGPCISFLRKMHPRMLLVARTDLWPQMLEQCRQRGIPVNLFSYTQKPLRGVSKKWITRWLLRWIRHVDCVSRADQENLQALASDCSTAIMGDTRYDQVAYRLNHPKALASGLRPKDDIPCLVAGSTWGADEAVLLPALAGHLLARKLRLILVPHEPTREHLHHLESQLNQLGISYALFSNGHWDSEAVLLVDQVGVLAELYPWGHFAFVGGSFKGSVHSVMEALGAGCYTFVGPHHENNREAVEFKALPVGAHFGLHVVHNQEELRARLGELLQAPESLRDFSQGLRREFNSRLGASAKLVDSLEEFLKA